MNRTLKNFLLDKFFKPYDEMGMVAWKSIGESLIDTGEVITNIPIDLCRGGIWNFVKIEDTPPNYIGCVKMTFDVNEFMSSDNKFFMDYYHYELRSVSNQLQEVKNRYEELKSFMSNETKV